MLPISSARRPPTTRRVAALLVAATAILVLGMSSTPAHACSCWFSEEWGFLGPDEGRLPANAVGVAWYSPSAYYEPFKYPVEALEKRFTVEIWEEGGFRRLQPRLRRIRGFPGVFVVGPRGEDLKVGKTYRFSVDKATRRVQVVATVDHESLSANTALDPHVGPVTVDIVTVAAPGSCSAEIGAAHVSIEARLDGSADRWREQLLFRTVVDDDVEWFASDDMCSTYVPGRSGRGIGQDRIFAVCAKTPGSRRTDEPWIALYEAAGVPPPRPRDYVKLRPGQHNLRVKAFLPGTKITLLTPERTVALSCG